MSEVDRIPPNAIDVEEVVLGEMLLDQEAAHQVFGVIDETAFYDIKLKNIFMASKKLYERNDPIDILTVSEVLNADSKLEEIGGALYLAELINQVGQGSGT